MGLNPVIVVLQVNDMLASAAYHQLTEGSEGTFHPRPSRLYSAGNLYPGGAVNQRAACMHTLLLVNLLSHL